MKPTPESLRIKVLARDAAPVGSTFISTGPWQSELARMYFSVIVGPRPHDTSIVPQVLDLVTSSR